ncbi:carbohydrate ABC transporter permease [Brachybacterium phenoliresistens]|uniref:ABC transporter permease n=2 Tax=Brachybacterium phenoliresistens TaxID=396014 RepID=Z9JN38_9MICO|nr:carbohydrate ABC transporter permease [Brachybacterium phenoliresistens]EWS79564.1 ABC transporter permease [Brachybacterium phenoliresistens]
MSPRTSATSVHERLWGWAFGRSERAAWMERPSLPLTGMKILVIGLVSISIIVPMLIVVSTSFASEEQLREAGGYVLFPTDPTLEAYRTIFASPLVFRALGVSVFVTVVGTVLALAVTICMAYALSRPVIGGRFMLMAIIVTMFFSPGLIPMYLMIKQLHLLNTVWSLILPGLFAAFNFIVMRSFFMGIPRELLESARIDGAGDISILVRIVLPLSKAVIAVIGLFYAVGFWNSFFTAMLYISDQTLWPIQLILRSYVIQGTSLTADSLGVSQAPPPQSIKMAVVVVALAPIVLVYPFLQKYFSKGVITGAIKG